ncbi:hypothetical protein C8A05DRAFT_19564, partial [Staphylotrichum tortipilum]
TIWTRTHWLTLDALLQARKRGSLHLQLELSRHPTHTTNPQPCRHLLGKQVSAQGETLTLEAWHLDVVEGFLAAAGGIEDGFGGKGGKWEAVQIAKRVFALLVGEERRRMGLVPVRDGTA